MTIHLLLSSFFLVALFTSASARKGYKEYPASYDNTDVNGILNNRPLRDTYVACLMDRGACSPEGQTLKDILPMAVADDCGECTPKQSYIFSKISKHFTRSGIPGDQKIWDEITVKYHINPRKV